jgi:hypothetical protein
MTVAEAHVVPHANPLVDERMTDRGRVEQRAAVDERRIGIGRMFVRIGGKRRERFDIADRPQPRLDRQPVRRVPAIDSESRLLTNEQQRGDWLEPEIERCPDRETSPDAGGERPGATAARPRRRGRRAPQRGGPIRTADLQPREQIRHEAEVIGRRIDAGQRPLMRARQIRTMRPAQGSRQGAPSTARAP